MEAAGIGTPISAETKVSSPSTFAFEAKDAEILGDDATTTSARRDVSGFGASTPSADDPFSSAKPKKKKKKKGGKK